jgi:hypothetical protein
MALMTIKHRAGVLPGFEPYNDPQRLLSSMTALTLDAPLSWLTPFINGALILDFVFGRLFAHLPCRSALAKGGVLPPPPMLAMLMIYAMVMSRLCAWLPVPPDTKADGRS